MSANVFKRLNVADTFVAPYTANKSWEISSSSFDEKKIIVNVGVNQSGSIFDPNSDYFTNNQYDRLVYDSINLLYYPSFFPTGSPLFYSERLNSPIFDATFTSASYWKGHINLGNLDTTKYFPVASGSVIYVLNIPKSLASEKILPNTFEVYFSSGSNYTAKIYDDGNYNLLYSGSNIDSSIGTVLSQSSYVGNVFYEQNVAILTVVPNSIRLIGWVGDDPYCIQAAAPSPSVTPSITKTPSETPSVTPSVTVSRSVPGTPSVTPTVTPTITVSSSPGATPSTTPTQTPTPTKTPTKTPTPTPTPTLPSYTINIYAQLLGTSGNTAALYTSPTGTAGTWTRRGSAMGSTCVVKYSDTVVDGTTIWYKVANNTDDTIVYGMSFSTDAICPGTVGTLCSQFVIVNSPTDRAVTSYGIVETC